MSAPVHSSRMIGWVLVAAQFALLTLIVLAPGAHRWSLPGWIPVGAAVAQALGLGVIVVGGLSLGRGGSVHPAPTSAATLRTGGLYRFARHPIYAGVLLFAAGTAARSGSPTGAIAAVALLGLLVVKAAFEERLLRARFSGYVAYAQATGRFGPRLRRPRV